MDAAALQTLLLGSRLKAAVAALVVVAGTLSGAVALGLIGSPSVAAVDNRFGAVDQRTTVVETDLVVANPNPVGAEFDDVTVDYAVRMNDVDLATGEKRGVQVDPGNTTLAFETEMRNDRIPEWWASHLANGESTAMVVDATVHSGSLGRSVSTTPVERTVDTDIAAAFDSQETRPIEADGLGPANPVAYVNETRGEWGNVNDDETPVLMEFDVYNPNAYPLAVTTVEYEVEMNDVVVGEGSTSGGVVVSPGAEETVTATTIIDNDRLDEWWVTHLERDQRTDLRIEFYAVVELQGTTARVPLDTVTTTFETDVFGNKAASGESAGEPQNEPAAEDDESDGTTLSDGPDLPTGDGTDDPEIPTDDDDAVELAVARLR